MLHQFFFSLFLFVLIKTLILNSHNDGPFYFTRWRDERNIHGKR